MTIEDFFGDNFAEPNPVLDPLLEPGEFDVSKLGGDVARDHDTSPDFVGKFAREEVAQHVGDRQPALEGDDLDAAAQFRRDVDSEAGGENVAFAFAGCDGVGSPNPCLRVARTRHKSALGIATAHRAILATSAARDMISRVAGPTSSSSPARRPVRAASAKMTR